MKNGNFVFGMLKVFFVMDLALGAIQLLAIAIGADSQWPEFQRTNVRLLIEASAIAVVHEIRAAARGYR